MMKPSGAHQSGNRSHYVPIARHWSSCARGLAGREDIDAMPQLDPVTSEVNRATCLAIQPDLAAKEAAWAVALCSGEPPRIAQACAAGIWVPGQELMAGYRDR